MNRKYAPIFALLILALVALACGGSDDAATATPAPSHATDQPAAPAPTSPPAESEEEPKESPTGYDTVFPLPDDVQNFTGGGGDEGINFQTSLSMDEAIEFYRAAFDKEGLTEYPVLTSIEDEGFSMVFTSWHSSKELVIQGVVFGDITNINIRLEEAVDAAESAPPDTTGGKELRSDYGGFAFQTIPDYTVEEAFGFARMEAPDADPDTGPAIMLIGAVVEESTTSEQLYDEFVGDLEADVEVSKPREVTVGGVPGLAVDVSGTEGDQDFAARLVLVAVTPTQSFTMIGMAPPERWDDELAPLFDAVMASISFFEPDLSFELPGEEGEEIRQWATSATASSEYGNPDWAASQATGAPDTIIEECADLPTAWASQGSDTVEWLELYYDTPVYPTEVNIIQTHSPDQVVMVELIDTEGTYHEVYTGEPENLWEECPYTLSILVWADYQAVGVKITIDQSVIEPTWNEIDAVELVGVSE